MRPSHPRLLLGLALAMAVLVGPLAAAREAASPEPKAQAVDSLATPAQLAGDSPAFHALAELPVLHVEPQGSRIKPLDTFSRLVVKEIFGRESIKLTSLDGQDETAWTAVGALFDWPVNPAFWDGREILLIDLFDYRGFKQWVLAESIKADLNTIAARPNTSASDRRVLETIAKLETISEQDLKALLKNTQLSRADAATLTTWGEKLAEGRKWIAPEDLENADVVLDGKTVNFLDAYQEIVTKARSASQRGETATLDPRQTRISELGQRLLMYQGFRDRNERELSALDILVTPRPFGEAYLAHTSSLIKSIIDGEKRGAHELSAWDRDVLATLQAYLEDISSLDGYLSDVAQGRQKPPGEDPAFDRNFTRWLQEKSRWVPLRIVLTADLDELGRSGFDTKQVESFRAAFESLVSSDRSAPGQGDPAAAQALLTSARALGEANNAKLYPEPVAMARETHYNRFAPFARAPVAYGTALVLLLLSLGLNAGQRVSARNKLDLSLYGLGMLAFVAGIGLEAYGFYLRVLISGWSPVTNMYETVIWVAFVAAILGLVMELVFRNKYAAIAASSMALLATLLAANVPLLDGNIKSLTPVLRDNYWLAVHVLTIVSSYAAFTLSLGFGLLAIGYYLSATYRRDVSYGELAAPLLPGLPLLLVSSLLLGANALGWFGEALSDSRGYIAISALGLPGLFLSVMGLYGLMGEYANRKRRSAFGLGVGLLALGAFGIAAVTGRDAPSWWPSQVPMYFVPGFVALSGCALTIMTQLGGRSREILNGNVAESALEEPSLATEPAAAVGRSAIDEIRASQAASRPTLDARGQAMQWVAAHVKPLSSFVYRAMQVGVLLVAAGTILGGVWADVSWGRFWGWDAKEVWALITLLVYLVPLHGRFAGWVSTFGLVGASVVCYMSVLMAWYGVNFVLGVGLHSYGFTDGGGQGVVAICVLAVLGVVGATSWRRWLGKRDRSIFA